MFLSDLFIQRPVFALVVSLLIVVGGVMALRELPVRELPDVDASVVTITTRYTGAAPGIIDTEITEVVEGAVARVDGVRRIESNSREGVGQTRVTFSPDRNIDSAAADPGLTLWRFRGECGPKWSASGRNCLSRCE